MGVLLGHNLQTVVNEIVTRTKTDSGTRQRMEAKELELAKSDLDGNSDRERIKHSTTNRGITTYTDSRERNNSKVERLDESPPLHWSDN